MGSDAEVKNILPGQTSTLKRGLSDSGLEYARKATKFKIATQRETLEERSLVQDEVWNLRRQVNDLDPRAISTFPTSDWESDQHFREEWISEKKTPERNYRCPNRPKERCQGVVSVPQKR